MPPAPTWPALLLLTLPAGCGGIAFDTRVAESAATRLAMIESMRIGDTTEKQFETRWGDPLQKVREGARVEYVYRTRTGPQERFVIATFEHGVAIGIRATETEGCRASFAPRIPGYAGDTPDIVKPIGWCARPGDPYVPNGIWRNPASAAQPRPGVAPDRYDPPPGRVGK